LDDIGLFGCFEQAGIGDFQVVYGGNGGLEDGLYFKMIFGTFYVGDLQVVFLLIKEKGGIRAQVLLEDEFCDLGGGEVYFFGQIFGIEG